MQDRYTGDVGDFGKYGLLRWLTGKARGVKLAWRLGVQWYLTEPEDNRDGRRLEYLDNVKQFRDCDEELYDFLGRIRRGELSRTVSSVERARMLPEGTLYFGKKLSFAGLPKGTKQAIKQRNKHRDEWNRRALATLKAARVVFLDPDTGLQNRMPRHRDRAVKYVYFDEVERFIEQGKTLVVYQHATRTKGGFELHLRNRMNLLRRTFHDKIGLPYCCVFKRYGSRAFIILPVGKVGIEVRKQAAEMVKHPCWSRHFHRLAPGT